jgi:hypothetical protein
VTLKKFAIEAMGRQTIGAGQIHQCDQEAGDCECAADPHLSGQVFFSLAIRIPGVFNSFRAKRISATPLFSEWYRPNTLSID